MTTTVGSNQRGMPLGPISTETPNALNENDKDI